MPPSGLQLRPAREEDRAACAEIYRDARQAAFHWETRRYDLEEFAGSTYGETLWVAEGANGEILAFASVWRAPDYWFLHNLFVATESQKQGIGRALLVHVLAEIGRPVELKTDVPNRVARRLYEGFGFAVVEESQSLPVPWFRMRLE
ncbi:GNAT family N-acetyltransferase [Pelagibius sp.]|uniref:GNAT family N-acetyltransferase n=1 Tax=Pelagibius sp. TaxID=1931238 RepID=UPI003BAE52B3